MTQEAKTHNEEYEAADSVIAAAGFVQLLILIGVLIAWLFTPLATLTSPVLSVSIMPWGIVLKTPSGQQVLYTGTVHLILGLLLADVLLLLIGVFTSGAARFASYSSSTVVLFIVDIGLVPPAGVLMKQLFITQVNKLVKDPMLLANLPIHFGYTLYCVLLILMLISMAVSFVALVAPSPADP